MFIIAALFEFQKMPVFIISHLSACNPGIIAENSILIYSGFKHKRLATSLPSVILIPLSFPVESTNCNGGRVGLVDITNVPFFTKALSGTVCLHVAAITE